MLHERQINQAMDSVKKDKVITVVICNSNSKGGIHI